MSKNKRVKFTDSALASASMRNQQIKETGSEKPLISLEKVMDCSNLRFMY